jgi:hypothetical protein
MVSVRHIIRKRFGYSACTVRTKREIKLLNEDHQEAKKEQLIESFYE